MNKVRILGIIYTFIITISLVGLPLYFGGKYVLDTILEAQTIHYETFGDDYSEDDLVFIHKQPFIYEAIDFYMDLFTGFCLFFSIREGIKIRNGQKGKDYYGDTQNVMTGTFMFAFIIFFVYYFIKLSNFHLFFLISGIVTGVLLFAYTLVISSFGDSILKKIFSWH